MFSNIYEELAKLNQIKNDIRQAIIKRGVDVPENTPFSEYPEKIKPINRDISFFDARTNYGKNLTGLFGDYKKSHHDKFQKYISSMDTSNVLFLNSLFAYNKEITEIDLSTWNTSNLVGAFQLFRGCTFLEYVDIRNFDLSTMVAVDPEEYYGFTGFGWAFYECSNLKTVRADNCNSVTLQEIFWALPDSQLYDKDYNKVSRVIYCRKESVLGLEHPEYIPYYWTLIYVD